MVYFESIKNQASVKQYLTLVETLRWLEANPSRKITLIGHSDNMGGDTYNLKLSQERVHSVAKFFTSYGISNTRLSILYKGSSEPAASNDTEEGRQLNRRVEMTINETTP